MPGAYDMIRYEVVLPRLRHIERAMMPYINIGYIMLLSALRHDERGIGEGDYADIRPQLSPLIRLPIEAA